MRLFHFSTVGWHWGFRRYGYIPIGYGAVSDRIQSICGKLGLKDFRGLHKLGANNAFTQVVEVAPGKLVCEDCRAPATTKIKNAVKAATGSIAIGGVGRNGRCRHTASP
jgi:hypothetical protein